jgi:GNAT superfamily N-acetyltransferase
MMGELEIRCIKSGEIPSLTDFYRATLATGNQASRLFEWRNSAPQRGNTAWGAWRADELLGTVNTVPCPVVDSGNHFNWSWQQDSIVAEALRGKGVGKLLVEHAACGQPVVIAKGISDTMYRLRKSIGFHDVGNANYLIRVLRPWNVGGSRRRRFLAPFLHLVTPIDHLHAIDSGIRVRTIGTFESAYDTILEEDQNPSTLGPLKPANYLNWRYTNCPVHSYTILEAFQGDRILGAIVLRLAGEQNGDAWIVDVICNLANSSTVEFLIDAAIQRASADEAAALLTFATSGRARTFLARSGFVDTHTSPQFVFRPQSPDDVASLKGKEWNFWHGDGDVELYQ